MTTVENTLRGGASRAAFSNAEVADLPAAVRRYLRASIADGTALDTCAKLRMRGHIKVRRWLPFTARQIVNPHKGLVWAARAAGLIAGSDRYVDGVGVMDWKLAGMVTLVHAEGADVSRSAAGRAGGEAILVPTALLPRFGVTWTATDDRHITAHYRLGPVPVELHLQLDPQSLPRSVVFQRWGDPDATGTWGWYPFGGRITGHRVFAGLTIPSEGRLGWHFGTDRWASGEFFRYRITSYHTVPPTGDG
jgi:hypothetical protein